MILESPQVIGMFRGTMYWAYVDPAEAPTSTMEEVIASAYKPKFLLQIQRHLVQSNLNPTSTSSSMVAWYRRTVKRDAVGECGYRVVMGLDSPRWVLAAGRTLEEIFEDYIQLLLAPPPVSMDIRDISAHLVLLRAKRMASAPLRYGNFVAQDPSPSPSPSPSSSFSSFSPFSPSSSPSHHSSPSPYPSSSYHPPSSSSSSSPPPHFFSPSSSPSHHSSPPPPSSGPVPSSSPTVPPTQQPEPEKLCAICFEKNVDSVIVPCGHMGCCEGCARSLADCPFCRKPITTIVRVYESHAE